MATTAVTTEVSSGLPVGAGPATSVSSSSAQPTPTSSNALNSAPEGATSSAGQSTELSPQDFGSLEDYAQALIDKKQSAVQSSEAENGAQAGAAAVPGEQDKDAWLEAGDQESQRGTDGRESQPDVNSSVGADSPDTEVPGYQLDLEGEEFLSTQGLNDKINANPALKQALEADWSSVNQHIFDSQLDFVRKNAERTGDHELVAALDVIRENVSPSFPATDELPPHLRAAADSINRREQELTRQQLMQQERNTRAFENSVADAASERINALVQPALEKTALSDFVRQTAREKIENAIVEGLNNNRFFQSRMAELSRFPASEEARQQRLNLIMTHVQAIAGPIVRQVLREASQPVIKAQEDRRAKIESQIARTRSEPKSVGGAAPLNGANQTPEQILTTAKTQLRDELGDEPSMQQVIERFARLRKTSS